MVYSENCGHDLETHWNATLKKCVPCNKKLKPGDEYSPNCGYTDDGGKREGTSRPCNNTVTFNNGSFTKCQQCTVCLPGLEVHPCNTTTDTLCRQTWSTTTNDLSTVKTTHGYQPCVGAGPESWGIAVGCGVGCVAFVAVLAVLSYFYRRRGNRDLCSKIRHRSSIIANGLSQNNGEFSRLDQPESNYQHILSPQVQAEPLQAVLDNLDVLEELVILLDPDSPGVKGTRHLASRCSYPATWITYSYSMKESCSPLKALLDGLTTKHPDWTVGHLAAMLQDMGRNNAVAVLNNLTVTVEV